MITLQKHNTVKATICVTLFTMATLFTLACGYSSKMTAPAAGAMPAISQLAPDSATAGAAGFTLTVNGSNFGTKSVVNWNGVAQSNTTFVTANQLTLAVPAAAIATSGTVMITVTNPGSPGTGIYGTGATLPETSTGVSFTIN
jgi:IPT/TIG domain-containing protein